MGQGYHFLGHLDIPFIKHHKKKTGLDVMNDHHFEVPKGDL